jgi:hypothetical protein
MVSTTLLRRAFVDICRGYSVGRTVAGETVYIRHLGHEGHADYEDIERGFKEQAAAKGAQTEAQRLEQLTAQGLWSPAREKEIETQRDFIGRMEEGRKAIAVPSLLRNHEDHIKREREKLGKLVLQRAELLRETVETYAARRLEDHYLVSNLFRDKDLTVPLMPPDQFDVLTDAEVEAIHEVYRAATEGCSEANLRRLAAQDFFQSYWSLAADNAQTFYGRPVCDLTYYQIRLAGVARYTKALIENTDMSRLTPEQRNDPDALERLHITQKNAATLQAEGKVPIAMTAADIKETGQQFSPLPPPNLSGVELVRWLQKNNAHRPR